MAAPLVVSLSSSGAAASTPEGSRSATPRFYSPWKIDCATERGAAGVTGHPRKRTLRDGVILRLAYTYGLSWKMLKRYLEVTLPNPEEVDGMTFQTLIRTGSEQGLLLSGWDRWVDYRKARGTTSHVYDEEKAREVFGIVPAFLEEARFLQERLSQKLKQQ